MASPLPRLGTYRILALPGTNPLPARGLSPAALTAFWVELVSAIAGKVRRRQEVARQIDAARAAGDRDALDGAHEWRYAAKIEVKTAESVLALLHELLAPDAPHLCDVDCEHVAAGATPAQAKAFLDALDVDLARLDERVATCGQHMLEDLFDERGVVRRWRERFAERLGG